MAIVPFNGTKRDGIFIPRVVADKMIAQSQRVAQSIVKKNELDTKIRVFGWTPTDIEQRYLCEVEREKALLALTMLVIEHVDDRPTQRRRKENTQ